MSTACLHIAFVNTYQFADDRWPKPEISPTKSVPLYFKERDTYVGCIVSTTTAFGASADRDGKIIQHCLVIRKSRPESIVS
jgi:hypothetical protein